MNTTDITIIPTINPDGFDRGEEGACSGRSGYKRMICILNNYSVQEVILRLGDTMKEIGILTGTSLHGEILMIQ